jgi:PilZ domain-containing protein
MRRHQRRELRASAKIICEQPKQTIDCILRDISEGGARLELHSGSDHVPEAFDLAIFPSTRRRSCSVAWRHDKQIGVTFE